MTLDIVFSSFVVVYFTFLFCCSSTASNRHFHFKAYIRDRQIVPCICCYYFKILKLKWFECVRVFVCLPMCYAHVCVCIFDDLKRFEWKGYNVMVIFRQNELLLSSAACVRYTLMNTHENNLKQYQNWLMTKKCLFIRRYAL